MTQVSEAKPIPREILDHEYRRLCRHAAAVLIQGMADTDIDFETMDARLGKQPGWAKLAIDGLILCKEKDLCTLSDLAVAMGACIRMTLYPMAPQIETAEQPQETAA